MTVHVPDDSRKRIEEWIAKEGTKGGREAGGPLSHLSVEDVYLACCGYDRSRKLGYLPEYMQMMNKGASGGYSEAQIDKARRT